ncbi:MAG: non-ribosomal peptide synthetase, partial [Cyanobacteria bacterium J06554_11]
IANTQMLLLDDDLQPVPTGAIGEIYVAGDGVSQGYLNQPERTESAFIPCPSSLSPYTKLYKTGDLGRYQPDGRLEWLGRSDRQVKIRGYRIELGEIEDALRGHGSVQEAVVIARSTGLATGLKTGLETDLVVDNESLVSALLALPAAQADELLATVEGGGG